MNPVPKNLFSPRAVPASSGLLIVHALVWLVLVVFLVTFVPRFKTIFQDFGLALPVATHWVVLTSDWLVAHWDKLPLVLSLFLTADEMVFLCLRQKTPGLGASRLWFGLMTVLPLFIMGVAVAALFGPFLKLMEGLSK